MVVVDHEITQLHRKHMSVPVDVLLPVNPGVTGLEQPRPYLVLLPVMPFFRGDGIEIAKGAQLRKRIARHVAVGLVGVQKAAIRVGQNVPVTAQFEKRPEMLLALAQLPFGLLASADVPTEGQYAGASVDTGSGRGHLHVEGRAVFSAMPGLENRIDLRKIGIKLFHDRFGHVRFKVPSVQIQHLSL